MYIRGRQKPTKSLPSGNKRIIIIIFMYVKGAGIVNEVLNWKNQDFTVPVSADCTCALGPVTTMIEDCWSLLGTLMFTS